MHHLILCLDVTTMALDWPYNSPNFYTKDGLSHDILYLTIQVEPPVETPLVMPHIHWFSSQHIHKELSNILKV